VVPAKAQFAGLGGGGDMMTQMAPMLEMMKTKMGKRRFGMMMQTRGPMMSQMMENGGGGFGSIPGVGIPGGFGGGYGYAAEGYGIGMGGGGDIMGMLGGGGGGEMMSTIPQLMRMASFSGGHRRHRRR
jgi:hypothetical protein